MEHALPDLSQLAVSTEATSGLRSRTADQFQRVTRKGWVVPGLRERLVEFYDAAKYYPHEQLHHYGIGAPGSIEMDPKVERAWDELITYFHAIEKAILELYPRIKQTWMSSNKDSDSLYALPLRSYYESKFDLVLEKRHLLAVNARSAHNVGLASSARNWANRLLASWAPMKERAYYPSAARPQDVPDGHWGRRGRQD